MDGGQISREKTLSNTWMAPYYARVVLVGHTIVVPNKSDLILSKVPGLIKEPEAVARNLEQGVEYEFRVAAVNDHGESEPLTTLAPIEARHPFGKTSFYRCIFGHFY